ncbi:GTP pyrophosphokinase [Burkholderia orbicola]|uniref:GTP pyrophosphokinase n=1 Tax=Burkholderia orbicola TaxID=2978683 RepID=UPI003AF5B843
MKGLHEDFSSSVERLIRDFLESEGIRFVDVVSRLKERTSLEGKISRKGVGRYQTLADITDICGARVITYLEGDVRRVADIVEREFEIDPENSVDKSRPVDPDRFGYRSVHYVVGHLPNRIKLREYARFVGLKIEIQIRSILQHAWAEIEHDLGYKSVEDVPVPVKRRFSRLAGLLELADEEFMTIRDELRKYEESLPRRLADSSFEVPVDVESLVAFFNSDEVVRRIDTKISSGVQAGLKDVMPNDVERRAAQMHFLGFLSIGEIRAALLKNENLIVEVADRWLHRDEVNFDEQNWPEQGMPRGISIFYLGYTLLLQQEDRAPLEQYSEVFFNGRKLLKMLLKVFPDFPRRE